MKVGIGLGLFLFLICAFFALVMLLSGWGVISSGSSDAVASMGNFTDNTSHWIGFSEISTGTPLIIWLFFGLLVAVGVWMFVRRLRSQGASR